MKKNISIFLILIMCGGSDTTTTTVADTTTTAVQDTTITFQNNMRTLKIAMYDDSVSKKYDVISVSVVKPKKFTWSPDLEYGSDDLLIQSMAIGEIGEFILTFDNKSTSIPICFSPTLESKGDMGTIWIVLKENDIEIDGLAVQDIIIDRKTLVIKKLSDSSKPNCNSTPSTTTTTTTTTTIVQDTTIGKTGKSSLNPDLVETYIPKNADLEWDTLKGYLHAYSQRGKNGSSYGISFYTGIWSTFEGYLPEHFQRGHGTWVTPDNNDTEEPLCRPGTVARDNWPERAPSYRDVFQTIEGGPGYWGNTQFPDPQMKYRVNVVTDCYTSQTSSPGWNWGGTSTLDEQAGIAQISNTLLYAPDGITFRRGTNGSFLGQAWMNLPLTSGVEEKTLVGKNNWTLFLNAGNFSGPTVYVTPEAWFRITDGYEPAQKRGLDSKLFDPYRSWALADEIGRVNGLVVKTGEKCPCSSFISIPKMNYPVDELGRTIYHQDLKAYYKTSIYDSIEKYINEGVELSSVHLDEKERDHFEQLYFEDVDFGWRLKDKEIFDLDKILSVEIFEKGKAWGIKWTDQKNAGMFPQYFVEKDNTIKILEAPYTDAFIKTNLPEVVLPPNPSGNNTYTGIDSYEPPSNGWPNPENGKTYEAILNDGSTILYGWYKFIDQPSIQKLNLSDEKKIKLQYIVEEIHSIKWGTNNPVLKPPTTGDLAYIDDALILTPPKGMEVGYVPIALRQYETNR